MNNLSMKLLAEKLDLSVGTVSKALKDSHEISEKTKQRVRDLASELNYSPNPFASSLRRGRSNTIAVVLPNVSNNYFSQIVGGIQAALNSKEYHLLIYLTSDNHEIEEKIFADLAKSGRVDGVIHSISSDTTDFGHITRLQENEIPLVFVGRACDGIVAPKIMTNDYECGYNAAAHLIACGCKKIAILSISRSLSMSHRRIEGFKMALDKHDIAFGEGDVIHATSDEEENEMLIRELLNGNRRPDGIIVTGERLTVKLYSVCESQGINVPGDLKVLSFSNLSCAGILKPALTTMSQPAFEMGETAARLLFDHLEKRKIVAGAHSEIIPSVLQVRRSTIDSLH